MPPGITEEDHALIKPYILLPIVLSAFERDISVINAAVKTPEPYAEIITAAMDRVTYDLTELRREFKQRGIKVLDMQRTERGYEAQYLCRGYQRKFALLDGLVRAEGGILMRKYLGLDTDNMEKLRSLDAKLGGGKIKDRP
ncbi:hypothetical protein [Paenibacillus chibensis]|uniref:hypothetical protein n=1 Tax=Paenibacillus chibensis TaxID=59846 RepID=UPI000FDB19EA|nr:hypothetical protein [Paenibacillus chibensis]MEC0370064.1 hypothetical protein [Paenibacillus chibensis]